MLRMKSDFQTLKPEDLQQYLHYIEQNCHRLLRFTNDLLRSPADQAKPPALLTSQCDIVSFLRCIIYDLSLLAEQRSIELQFDNQIAEPFLLNFDRDQLERLLWNLMINALKHAPRGGSITLRLHSDQEYVYIGIADNGDGITKDSLSNIFDPHVTDHRSEGEHIPAHGLGLPIARQLAELHQGSIFVSSAPGGGTCFTFSISRHLPLTMNAPIF